MAVHKHISGSMCCERSIKNVERIGRWLKVWCDDCEPKVKTKKGDSEMFLVYIGSIALFIFLISATVQSLSYQFHRDTPKRWFVSAIASAAVLGVLLAWILEKRFTASRGSIESLSLLFLQWYLYGSFVGVISFPAQLGRALYKILHGRDVKIRHTRKPRVQQKYKTVGYSCGNCGRSLSGQVSQCPHCGVRFGGTKHQYLPGTPPPKHTTTETRNTTSLAGFSVLVLLLLDMLYGVSLFEIRQLLIGPETMSLLYIFGGPVVNLIIVGIAGLLVKRYAKTRGVISKESYY
jgi:hypothetical protein